MPHFLVLGVMRERCRPSMSHNRVMLPPTDIRRLSPSSFSVIGTEVFEFIDVRDPGPIVMCVSR